MCTTENIATGKPKSLRFIVGRDYISKGVSIDTGETGTRITAIEDSLPDSNMAVIVEDLASGSNYRSKLLLGTEVTINLDTCPRGVIGLKKLSSIHY